MIFIIDKSSLDSLQSKEGKSQDHIHKLYEDNTIHTGYNWLGTQWPNHWPGPAGVRQSCFLAKPDPTARPKNGKIPTGARLDGKVEFRLQYHAEGLQSEAHASMKCVAVRDYLSFTHSTKHRPT